MDSILRAARVYLQNGRDSGASDQFIDAVTQKLLAKSVQVLRSRPFDANGVLNIPPDDLTLLFSDVSPDNPHHYSRMMRAFFEKLLLTPHAADTLGKLSAAGAN
jgi:hypothetical protein